MTKQDVTAIVAILTTLAECEGSPESMIYLAIGADLNRWYQLKAALVSTDLIHEEYNFVTITDKGRVLAEKINAAQRA